jgi:hypothetical protein
MELHLWKAWYISKISGFSIMALPIRWWEWLFGNLDMLNPKLENYSIFGYDNF